ncbi:MAG: hypothetical protein COA32_13815 [Fluviicola sp.]|nr:MAG: hypothetical protein COA32_13815 [Fluviicola sp.]
MKKSVVLIILSLVVGFKTLSQEQENASKSTIAVALPNVDNIDVSREIIAKLLQIELIKLDMYKVYDEFDIQEGIDSDERFTKDCYGKNCLIDLGKAVEVDYIVSTSLLGFGGKTVISIKIIEIATGNIVKNDVKEFIDDESKVQRMLQVLIRQMHDIEMHPEVVARIVHDDQPIIKKNVGRVNNSGPRVGYSFLTGDLKEFAERPESQGGMDIYPGVSMIGYQLEKQYIGTENFSALGEMLFTVSGLEQGIAIPSITVMNGLRFGKSGWEFAFGPGFGIKRTSQGFFDTQGIYGERGKYWSKEEYNSSQYSVNQDGEYSEPEYDITENRDHKGEKWGLNTRWVMAFGRTFRAGGLNIPVNVFYSSMKNSGMIGLSVGFNVVKN